MFEAGHLKVLRIRGIPIRLHWTLPIGMMVFGGLRFAPAFWAGFFLLVLLHELGHAALVRWFGHGVLSVDVTGFGGLCRWAGRATPMERGAIAWGGVLAQALVLLATLLVVTLAGPPRSLWAMELVSVFTWTNLWLIGLNLLPIPPLDGADAWRFVGGLVRGQGFPRRGRRNASVPPPRVESVAWTPSRLDPRFSRPIQRVWARFRERTRGRPKQPPPPSNAPPRKVTDAELAEMLRQVGDEAGRARRGQS